jgi:hypothetical protein
MNFVFVIIYIITMMIVNNKEPFVMTLEQVEIATTTLPTKSIDKHTYDDEYNYNTFSDYNYGDSGGDDDDYYYYFDDQILNNDDIHNCPSQCNCQFDPRNETTVLKKNQTQLKYDIKVDCSSQKLTTIRDLFDTNFPLDQIVNL